MGSLSVGHWIIVLAVIVLVFGTKKLGTAGSDLGKAVKGFKDGMRGEEENAAASANIPSPAAREAKDR